MGDGASPENVQIPASKLVVGKHTNGDGSSFIDGETLKNVFNSALADGRWSAGFMSWQFYKELYPSSGTALIDSVINANWDTTSPTTTSTTSTTTTSTTTATPTTTTTTDPVTSTTTTSTSTASLNTENIQIVNYHGSSKWYFAASLNGVSHGFAVNKFEIRKADNQWHECGQCADDASLFTCTVDSVIALPFGVRLTGAHSDGSLTVISSNDAVSAFAHGVVSDFGSNFAETASTTTTTSSTTTSTTASNPDGSDEVITLTNRPSNTGWYYTVSVSSEVTSVEMRGNGQSDWTMGEYMVEYAGNYYKFEAGEYLLPLSFRVTATDGSVTTSYDLIDSFDAGVTGTMTLDGAAPFEFGEGKNGGSTASIYGFGIILGLIAVVLVIVIVVCWRRRVGKADVSIETEVTIENSFDPEAQIEQVDGGRATTIDVVTR